MASALSWTGFFIFIQTPSTCPLLSFLCSPGLCILLWAVAWSLWGLSENLYTKFYKDTTEGMELLFVSWLTWHSSTGFMVQSVLFHCCIYLY